jgi:hypothetical protein
VSHASVETIAMASTMVVLIYFLYSTVRTPLVCAGIQRPRMIEWDETDVLTCLEVEPEIGKDRLYYRYIMRQEGLTLELIVYPYDGDAQIMLIRPDQGALTDIWMRDCRAIRYVRTEDREQLLFLSQEGREYRPNLPHGLCLTARPLLRVQVGDPLTTSLGAI